MLNSYGCVEHFKTEYWHVPKQMHTTLGPLPIMLRQKDTINLPSYHLHLQVLVLILLHHL